MHCIALAHEVEYRRKRARRPELVPLPTARRKRGRVEEKVREDAGT